MHLKENNLFEPHIQHTNLQSFTMKFMFPQHSTFLHGVSKWKGSHNLMLHKY